MNDSRYITLDFDPIVEGADLPEGTYKVCVLEANFKEASTGNKMVELVMDVVDDPLHNGRRLFDNIVLIPKAAWKLKQVLTGLGLPVSSNLNLDDWVNKYVWVDVRLEKDSGRARPEKYRRV